MAYIAVSLTSAMAAFILYKLDVLHVFRLVRKFFTPKTYKIPTLSALDYPLPPFPNTWYPVCMGTSIQNKEMQKHKIAGMEFIFYRDEYGTIHATHKNCPHMGVDLSYGYVEKQCIVCPMHCMRVKSTPKQPIFVEETNNLVFIWIGELVENKPPISVFDLFIQNDLQQSYVSKYGHFTHKVGGHLVDYAEHLLDINHAPYIHGVHIEPIPNSLVTTKYSFTTKFRIQESGLLPTFTYATPTFGCIRYTEDVHVYIMFVVRDVGEIDMVIMPGWVKGSSVKNAIQSMIGTIYTYIDFSDEAAYFTTKNHRVRHLKQCEKPMDDFRNWFQTNFYSKLQNNVFAQRQSEYLRRENLNDW